LPNAASTPAEDDRELNALSANQVVEMLEDLQRRHTIAETDVAELVGTTVETLRKWVAGTKHPSLAHRQFIAMLHRASHTPLCALRYRAVENRP